MNLSKVKELEEIKEEQIEKSNEYGKMLDGRKHQYFSQSKVDFVKFFKEHGFSIENLNAINNGKSIEAKYKNTSVRLIQPSIENDYIGVYSVFDLYIKGTGVKEEKYLIRLNTFGSYPKVTSIFSSDNPNKTDDEKVQEEIEKIKSSIAELNEKIENFQNTKWGFGLLKEVDRPSHGKYPQFETMTDLLKSLFS